MVRNGHQVLSNVIASQHDLHAQYGGVVPEIASRAHIEKILPVIDQAMKQANASFDDLSAIAVGNRPGLIGSLLVAVSAAKALAWTRDLPLIGIDHVQSHLYAANLVLPPKEGQPQAIEKKPEIPEGAALGLVVSGGHTSLYRVDSPLDLTLMGRTIDDAVGEAYDKAAVILNAGYPGGPKLDKLAQQGNAKAAAKLPISLLGKESLDFSFSGLKTALLYQVRGQPKGRGREAYFERSASDLDDQTRADMAAAFQEAAIGAVMAKLDRALDQMTAEATPPSRLLVGGGVSANSYLRTQAQAWGERRGIGVCIPPMSLCLDNAAMIGGLAHHCFIQGQFDDLHLPAMATSQF